MAKPLGCPHVGISCFKQSDILKEAVFLSKSFLDLYTFFEGTLVNGFFFCKEELEVGC